MNFNPSYNKNFYPVTPMAMASSAYGPANFGNPTLFNNPFPYTPVNRIESENSLTMEGRDVTRSLIPYMGKLFLNGSLLGSAIAINANHVLIPRHCIDDLNIEDLIFKGNSGIQQKCICVVEEDAVLDYAILRIPGAVDMGSPKFTQTCNQDLLLLHRPGGNMLGVSGHSMIEDRHARIDGLMPVYHDTGYESCGGAYVDSDGRICALHLGIDVTHFGYSFSANMGTGSPERYALPIQTILDKNPNGYLSCFLRNDFDRLELINVDYLKPFSNVYDWEREGRESQKKLTDLLSHKKGVSPKTDPTIFTQEGIVSFQTVAKVKNLDRLYKNEFREVYKHSLGRSGLHGDTLKYSINGYIESDHPLPWDVWNKTTNPNMQGVIQKGTTRTSRTGEDQMPAITIPYSVHRDLMTTGSKTERKQFRQQLVDYCDKGDTHLALGAVIDDYQRNKLLGPGADPQYKKGWKDMLGHFHLYKIITDPQKQYLLNKLQ